MKRSDEVNEDQGMEEQKRSRAEEESSKPSDFNPFLVEPILRKLLKKVDTVTQLKDLRKMCVLWDKVNIEELEDRAFKGKIKAIDFQWTDRFETKEEAQTELVEFLEDTLSIPQLFCSFKFSIPQSLKVLQDHTDFFTDYHISQVELYTPLGGMGKFEDVQVALKYFLTQIKSNLKEIQMPLHAITFERYPSFEFKAPNWSDQELALPKLEKLVIENGCYGQKFIDFFKSILAVGHNHITSLMLSHLPGADIGSFPGLDPARMTRLDVKLERGSELALKFSSGLITLVEKGMRLVDFGISLFSEFGDSFSKDIPSIFFNMTHFFDTQSSTLTRLHFQLNISAFFRYNINVNTPDEIKAEFVKYGKIRLPVFQALETLHLNYALWIENIGDGFKTHDFSIFDFPLSPPLHFPSLVNVIFASEPSMDVLCGFSDPIELAQVSPYHFKRFELQYISFHPFKTNLGPRILELIGSVEYLDGPASILEQLEIPWTDSLRELCIKHVKAPLKLAHLKKLETLNIVELRMFESQKIVDWNSEETSDSDSDSDSDSVPLPDQESVSKYLSFFSEATQLSLPYIKFVGLYIKKRWIKGEFIRYFPFPVHFEEREYN